MPRGLRPAYGCKEPVARGQLVQPASPERRKVGRRKAADSLHQPNLSNLPNYYRLKKILLSPRAPRQKTDCSTNCPKHLGQVGQVGQAYDYQGLGITAREPQRVAGRASDARNCGQAPATARPVSRDASPGTRMTDDPPLSAKTLPRTHKRIRGLRSQQIKVSKKYTGPSFYPVLAPGRSTGALS